MCTDCCCFVLKISASVSCNGWTRLTNAAFPSELRQIVTNTVVFNLFRLSFLLLPCLRRLTHTLKHTVSTMRRQSSTQPVSIMQEHTRFSCHLDTQASCFSLSGRTVAQFCLRFLSQAFFFSPSLTFPYLLNCCHLFLALPSSPQTSFTPIVCCSSVYVNVRARSGRISRAVVQTDRRPAGCRTVRLTVDQLIKLMNEVTQTGALYLCSFITQCG